MTLAVQVLMQTVADMLERKEAIDKARSPLFEMDNIPIPFFFTCTQKKDKNKSDDLYIS